MFRLSDADATYSGHKGQGFQAQIMEAFSEDKKEPVLNLITHVEVEPSLNSDAPTLISPIKSVCPQGHIPVKTRKRKDRLTFISDSLSFLQSHPDFEFLRLHHI
jgi:hypothetical protein